MKDEALTEDSVLTCPVLSADAGYWDAASVADPALAGFDVLIAVPEDEKGKGQGPTAAAKQAMRDRLAVPATAAEYARRAATVEPVFGQTKQQRRFRQFSLRGRERVAHEWQLICLTHNLRKLCAQRRRTQNGTEGKLPPSARHRCAPCRPTTLPTPQRALWMRMCA